MKAGEYVGRDGHMYRFFLGSRYLHLEAVDPSTFYPPGIAPKDARAAAAALIALADELETEYIELPRAPLTKERWRLVLRNGEPLRAEWEHTRSGEWTESQSIGEMMSVVYRAGLAKGAP